MLLGFERSACILSQLNSVSLVDRRFGQSVKAATQPVGSILFYQYSGAQLLSNPVFACHSFIHDRIACKSAHQCSAGANTHDSFVSGIACLLACIKSIVDVLSGGFHSSEPKGNVHGSAPIALEIASEAESKTKHLQHMGVRCGRFLGSSATDRNCDKYETESFPFPLFIHITSLDSSLRLPMIPLC